MKELRVQIAYTLSIMKERSYLTIKYNQHVQNNLIIIVVSSEHILMKRCKNRMLMENTGEDQGDDHTYDLLDL